MTISGHQVIQARYWYDGQYVNNAKEDAAEVALQQLMMSGASLGGGGGGGGGGARGGGNMGMGRGEFVGQGQGQWRGLAGVGL